LLERLKPDRVPPPTAERKRNEKRKRFSSGAEAPPS